MSAFDDLYAEVLAQGAPYASGRGIQGLGPVEALDVSRIGKALQAARRSEGEPLPEHYALPDYPGQRLPLRVDGVEVGVHGLEGGSIDTHYRAVTSTERVTLPLLLRRRRLLALPRVEEAERAAFGPVVRTGARDLDRHYAIRTGARAMAFAFLGNALVEALERVGPDVVDAILLPDGGRMTSEVRVRVESAKDAAPAVSLARAVHRAMVKLTETAGGFVESGAAAALSPEELERLVSRVTESLAFLSGHAARLGDGVEARLELDTPAGLRCALRIDPAAEGGLRVHFRGDVLTAVSGRGVRLTPETGFLQKARGLLDTKLGHDPLDKAFVVDGDVSAARLLTSDAVAALRLGGRQGSLALDAAGVLVELPRLPNEDEALLEVLVATIALWRAAALASVGLGADLNPDLNAGGRGSL